MQRKERQKPIKQKAEDARTKGVAAMKEAEEEAKRNAKRRFDHFDTLAKKQEAERKRQRLIDNYDMDFRIYQQQMITNNGVAPVDSAAVSSYGNSLGTFIGRHSINGDFSQTTAVLDICRLICRFKNSHESCSEHPKDRKSRA